MCWLFPTVVSNCLSIISNMNLHIRSVCIFKISCWLYLLKLRRFRFFPAKAQASLRWIFVGTLLIYPRKNSLTKQRALKIVWTPPSSANARTHSSYSKRPPVRPILREKEIPGIWLKNPTPRIRWSIISMCTSCVMSKILKFVCEMFIKRQAYQRRISMNGQNRS